MIAPASTTEPKRHWGQSRLLESGRAIEVAQTTLANLIAELISDEEVEIMLNQKTVARTVPPKRGMPQFGNCKGMLTIVSDDDEHLRDFAEYMY